MCVDSSNAFRLLDVHQRRLAACQENVEFPLAPTGKGAWGGEGDVHPMNGVAFNPEDPLQSMLLFNHRCVFTTDSRNVDRGVDSVVMVRFAEQPMKAAMVTFAGVACW